MAEVENPPEIVHWALAGSGSTVDLTRSPHWPPDLAPGYERRMAAIQNSEAVLEERWRESIRQLVAQDPAADVLAIGSLCSQTDPEAFYPAKGGNPRPATGICALCFDVVREACGEASLQGQERYGIWGGMSRRTRKAILGAEWGDDEDEDVA